LCGGLPYPFVGAGLRLIRVVCGVGALLFPFPAFLVHIPELLGCVALCGCGEPRGCVPYVVVLWLVRLSMRCGGLAGFPLAFG